MSAIIFDASGKRHLALVLRTQPEDKDAVFLEGDLRPVATGEDWHITKAGLTALERLLVTHKARPDATSLDHLLNRHLQRCLQQADKSGAPVPYQVGSLTEYRLTLTARGDITEAIGNRIHQSLEQLAQEHFPNLIFLPPTWGENVAQVVIALADKVRRELIPLLCKHFNEQYDLLCEIR